jgi:hypothetical protein
MMKQAEKILATTYPNTIVTNMYIASFKTRTGKEIALQRTNGSASDGPYYCWLQHHPGALQGVSIRNQSVPGMSYGPNQARTAGLSGKTAPALMVGNRAYYVKVENLAALSLLATTYNSTPMGQRTE